MSNSNKYWGLVEARLRAMRNDKKDKIEAALLELEAIVARGKGDPEIDHIEADKVLLRLIDNPSITELFEKIRKWYA